MENKNSEFCLLVYESFGPILGELTNYDSLEELKQELNNLLNDITSYNVSLECVKVLQNHDSLFIWSYDESIPCLENDDVLIEKLTQFINQL
jgi:hypothetical protein